MVGVSVTNTITRCGITVPESRFYDFVMFGKVNFYGKICRLAIECGNVDEWQGHTDCKWEHIGRAVEHTIQRMLPHGEDEIIIQCCYWDFHKAERVTFWTAKQWHTMIGKFGQTELFIAG